MVYLTSYGRFIAALMPAPPKNVMLRTDQYQPLRRPGTVAGPGSKAVVRAKIANQRTLLMRSLRSSRTRPKMPTGTTSRRRGQRRARRAGDGRASAADRPRDRPGVLLGLEGQAAALYFGKFGRMLKSPGSPDRPFDFTTRNRRPPRDPVNALLSFAYAMLAKDCFSAACTVGFDPYQGFYHCRPPRPALAGPGPDGGIPLGYRRFRRPDPDQQRYA